MSESQRKPSERYYLTYQRHLLLSLLFVLALGAYNLVAILKPASGRPGLGALAIGALYLVAFLAVHFITLRGRRWRRRDPDVQTILRDEWTLANRGRATQVAFWVVLLAQFPMMFLMAYVPPEPSVVGMGTFTFLLGLGVFCASHLYFSRQPSDG